MFQLVSSFGVFYFEHGQCILIMYILFLLVSSCIVLAYVAGMPKGIVREKLFHLGDTLKPGITLDIDAELKLVEERKKELSSTTSMNAENIAMKELGFQRLETIVIILSPL